MAEDAAGLGDEAAERGEQRRPRRCRRGRDEDLTCAHAREVVEAGNHTCDSLGNTGRGGCADERGAPGAVEVLELYESAIGEGAQASVGGGAAHVESAPNGFFVEPTVFVDTTNTMRINREEIFGPAVAIIEVADVDEAVHVANDTEYGLAAAVWTRDATLAQRVSRSLNAGTVWVNMYGGLDPYAAYGGRGLSGYGYEQGPQAIDEYTTLKTVRQAV
jgi:acyl-CoA reductase-like NAD-dependent aldehyde dehydrogenase